MSRPTPTIFAFPPSEPSINATPSLSVHSPGGTGRPVSTPPPGSPQPSPTSPSRSYCPVMRGMTAGLNAPTATNTVRSPSVNRLGSLFNSINRSVTSAFSNFVAVNQPVPGVIQDDDQPSLPPTLPRQQSQPRFKPPSRRGSSQESTATQKVAPFVPETSITAPRSSTPERAEVQQLRTAADEGPGDGARPPPPQRAPASVRRPRPRDGLPINDIADPPSLVYRSLSQRGNTRRHFNYDSN